METELVKVDMEDIDESHLQRAAVLLSQDEIIGFPTETVYGLGGSAYSSDAIKKIFEAKGRPADNPLIVHIANLAMLSPLVEKIPQEAIPLMQEFWPGPLTILFEKSNLIPDIVTAGLSTVAIRMPSHPVALKLIEMANIPIAAPSANVSGRPSPTTAQHVWEDLQGKIPLIIDSGPCPVGVESTVIDINRKPPLILRPGGMNLERLQKLLPTIEVYGKNLTSRELELRPSTPGLKYRHYSPKAPVYLIEGEDSSVSKFIETETSHYSPKTIGIIHIRPSVKYSDKFLQQQSPNIINLIEQANLENDDSPNYAKAANGIFAALRELDSRNVDIIYVEGIPEIKEGLAVMNRLRKAASKIIAVDS